MGFRAGREKRKGKASSGTPLSLQAWWLAIEGLPKAKPRTWQQLPKKLWRCVNTRDGRMAAYVPLGYVWVYLSHCPCYLSTCRTSWR